MNNILTVIRKEFARFFRDKRLVLGTLILPGVLIFLLYTLMGSVFFDSEETYTVKVVNPSQSFAALFTPAEEGEESPIVLEDADASEIDSIKAEIKAGNIDALVVLRDAVQVRVDARQEAGPRRRTERHRAEEVGEGNPFALEPRDVRRLEERVAAAAPDGVVGQVVEQNEEHVGPFGRLGCLCAGGEKPRRTGTDDQWQMRSHGLSLFGRLLAGCVQ